MALPDVSMRQLLEAGAHFGHQSHRWNPKMALVHLRRAQQHPHHRPRRRPCRCCTARCRPCRDTVAKGGRVLFVGTKRQAADSIADAPRKRSAQYYVNARWLGGMLTNWKTDVRTSIQRLRKVEEDAGRRQRLGPHEEGAPAALARARQAREARSAASRTWAARRT
jgi:small subunit ribosomal protein S2